MMSPEKLDELIQIGEQAIELTEQELDPEKLKISKAHLIQLSMLKTFKFVRDYED